MASKSKPSPWCYGITDVALAQLSSVAHRLEHPMTSATAVELANILRSIVLTAQHVGAAPSPQVLRTFRARYSRQVDEFAVLEYQCETPAQAKTYFESRGYRDAQWSMDCTSTKLEEWVEVHDKGEASDEETND